MFSLDIATTPAGRRREAWIVGSILLACLVLPRVMHLGPIVDEPHAWVQIDREFSVWAYYRHGLSLFDMHVCYFGGHRTAVLEFPLPNLVPAVLYRIFGPHVLLARLSTLAFFIGAALFLYLFVKYLFDRRLATIALAVYLVLPLGVAFSRAVLMHDFFAIFMAHAMAYLYLRGFDQNRNDLVALGCVCATLGLLVKAPYVFFYFLPLGVHFLRARRPSRLLRLIPVFVLPLAPFLMWRHYADRVNAQQPDWSFLPTYFRYDDLSAWFYGPLEMRFELENWLIIEERIVLEVLTPIGLVLFAFGLWFLRGHRHLYFLLLWIAGALIAVVIFFNLNVVHNYYQNPLIAIGAVGIAAFFRRLLPDDVRVSWVRSAAVTVVFFAFVAGCALQAELSYYEINWTDVHAGRALAETTDEDALVVVVSPTILSAQEPTLLGRAHRYGWPVSSRWVTVDILERLRRERATVVAWLELGGDLPPPHVLEYLASAPVDVRDLPDGSAKLYVFHLVKADHG